MCGISGVFQLSANQLPLKELIGKMNSRLVHRGLDDNGVWLDDSNKLALGQTQLSILDLSSVVHQPIHDTFLIF